MLTAMMSICQELSESDVQIVLVNNDPVFLSLLCEGDSEVICLYNYTGGFKKRYDVPQKKTSIGTQGFSLSEQVACNVLQVGLYC